MTEHSLHLAIKKAYSLPGDQFEVKQGNYIIDILRGNMAIEVQTKNFSAIKPKLQTLTQKQHVRLVYPLTERKTLTYINKTGQIIEKRKSTKKGILTDVFRELIRIPTLLGNDKFSLEILFIDEEEVRCADGKGSWRRKGVSIKERKLVSINSRILFQSSKDFLKLLPDGLNEVFTNSELAKQAKMPVRTARQITYCLRKSGLIQATGKKGKQLTFKVTR
ncbi:MAG: hypothetical protein ACQCN5_08345 [Candidatus Bathyarchaeia archaeon]|jgi:hypothetical protein